MKIVHIIIFISIFSLLACQSNTSAPSKEVVAKVKGKYLYLIDIQNALPAGLNKKDSAEFARTFIQNWASDELMYDIARSNIPDKDRVDGMVEEYRRQLISAEYQRYLIEEKLANEITDEEVAAYYTAHKLELVLKKDQIKGLFIKIPIKAPQQNQLRSWMTLKKPESIGNIEKYAIQHAVGYEYFVDQWKDLETIMANIPYSISNTTLFFRQNKQLTVQDSSYYYLLTIKEFAASGSPFPQELAQEEVKTQLISQRKTNYIVQFRNELMKKAIKDKDIEIIK
jgi:hypothetical protein